jgi:hypothetical protein
MIALSWRRIYIGAATGAAVLAVAVGIFSRQYGRPDSQRAQRSTPELNPDLPIELPTIAMPPRPDRQVREIGQEGTGAEVTHVIDWQKVSPVFTDDVEAAIGWDKKSIDSQIELILKSADRNAVAIAFQNVVDSGHEDKVLGLLSQRPEVEPQAVLALVSCTEKWAWREVSSRIAKLSPSDQRQVGGSMGYKIHRDHSLLYLIPLEHQSDVVTAIRDMLARDSSWPQEFRRFIDTL